MKLHSDAYKYVNVCNDTVDSATNTCGIPAKVSTYTEDVTDYTDLPYETQDYDEPTYACTDEDNAEVVDSAFGFHKQEVSKALAKETDTFDYDGRSYTLEVTKFATKKDITRMHIFVICNDSDEYYANYDSGNSTELNVVDKQGKVIKKVDYGEFEPIALDDDYAEVVIDEISDTAIETISDLLDKKFGQVAASTQTDKEVVKASTQSTSQPIMAADDDDPFAAKDEFEEDAPEFNDEDDAEASDETQSEDEDDDTGPSQDVVDIDTDNNIADHYIAECSKCHGIFISPVIKSDQLIDEIQGVCPLCHATTSQKLKWIVELNEDIDEMYDSDR